MDIPLTIHALKSIDDRMATAINTLLNAAGSSATVASLSEELGDLNTRANLSADRVRELEYRISELSARRKIEPVAVAASGEIPGGTSIMMKASEIFSGPSGEKSPMLDFEVPCYAWESPHPHVPQIDHNYKFKLNYLVDLLWAITTNQNAWLFGHTGTGKTTMLEQVCARLGWPVSRINLDSGVERIDLLGKTDLRQEAGATVTKFIDGIIPHAMEHGHFLIIDEIDFGRSDVLYAIQRALESKGLVLTEDGGRFVRPHPMFRIAATANTKGQGDELGLYQGAKVQSTALLNRFTVWLEVDYLDHEDECNLIRELCNMTPEDANSLATFAQEMRVAFKSGELTMPVSPREIIPVGHAFNFFVSVTKSRRSAMDRAIEMMLSRKVPKDNLMKLQEIANRTLNFAD